MKLRIIFIPLATLLLVCVVRAQETDNASQTLENLRAHLSEVQDQEAQLKIRLDQLNFDLKPENIERYFNGSGSTRPEELREARRRQLQIEKDRVVAQLKELESSHTRLEAAISTAQARAYQQTSLGAAALQTAKNLNAPILTVARVLLVIAGLLVVLGSLLMLLMMRRRKHL